MRDLDSDTFDRAVADALNETGGESRQVNAVERAIKMLDNNPHVDFTNGVLLVVSDTSFNVYEVTADECQCESYLYGKPCKHKAAHDLLSRCDELDRDGQVELAVTYDRELPHFGRGRTFHVEPEPGSDMPLVAKRPKSERCGAFQI